MDWWQLIDFDNPDNEFRVVRNIYRSVSMSRITLRQKRYPQEALQSSGIGGLNHPSHYNGEIGGLQTPVFTREFKEDEAATFHMKVIR